jgi:hypothetical protein
MFANNLFAVTPKTFEQPWEFSYFVCMCTLQGQQKGFLNDSESDTEKSFSPYDLMFSI